MDGHKSRILAGVDVGTLTCRLLIAEVTQDEKLTELHSERRILRLGEGLAANCCLSQAAMTRVIEVLREWRQVIKKFDVEAEVSVATSAVREASNRDDFLQRTKRETGFDIEVISGEEEARRTMIGIRSGLATSLGDVLGLDIGGGSTEFILHRPETSPRIFSLDLGVVRLTEKVLIHDPPRTEELRSARDLIRDGAELVLKQFGDLQAVTLVGTAGTITTLAAMAQRLPAYEVARIHNYSLGLGVIGNLEEDLLQKTSDQRQGMFGLEPGREDVIVAGILILRGIMEVFGFTSCLVSDFGLREGVVLHLANKMG